MHRMIEKNPFKPGKPLKKFHHHGWGNGMCVSIFPPQETPDGKRRYQMQIDKTYLDYKTKEWKHSHTYHVPDALSLIPLLQQAVTFIDELEENKRMNAGLGEDSTNGLGTPAQEF